MDGFNTSKMSFIIRRSLLMVQHAVTDAVDSFVYFSMSCMVLHKKYKISVMNICTKHIFFKEFLTFAEFTCSH